MTDVISYEDLVFEWETLDNKTLHIYTYKSEDGSITAGIDEDENIYILNIKPNKE